MAAGPIGSVWDTGTWTNDSWESGTWATASEGAIPFVGDMNTRLLAYLRDYYSLSGGDLTTLATKYMDALTTGDRNQRFKKLIQDATDAMT